MAKNTICIYKVLRWYDYYPGHDGNVDYNDIYDTIHMMDSL